MTQQALKLLNELVDELTASQPNLTDALIKTKVLLHKLGRKDLAEWVNHELNGYPDGATVPSYRILPAVVKGNVTNGAFWKNDHPLPTLHLDAETRNNLERLTMHDSIAVIEALTSKDSLSRPLPIELGGLFNSKLGSQFKVQQAWCEIGAGRLPQVTAEVRSKLLDFLLDLSALVDTGMSEDQVKQVAQSPTMGSMFNNAIFGDNVTIVVGDHNQQSVEISNRAGDFDALATLLREKRMAESDIADLKKAIEADAPTPEVAEKQLGPRVKSWLTSMLGKAVDTAWQIEVGIAGGLLTTALQQYYGW